MIQMEGYLFSQSISINIIMTAHYAFSTSRSGSGVDVDPGSRSRVNESPHPARLGRGVRRRGLSRHRGDAADLPPLAAAVRRYAGRGSQAADSEGVLGCKQCSPACGG